MAETLDELVRREIYGIPDLSTNVIAVMQSYAFIDRKHEVKKGVMAE
jgi:hypothetical protein